MKKVDYNVVFWNQIKKEINRDDIVSIDIKGLEEECYKVS